MFVFVFDLREAGTEETISRMICGSCRCFVVFLLSSFVLAIENFGTNKRGEVYLKESKPRNCGKVHQQHYTSIVLLLNSSINEYSHL